MGGRRVGWERIVQALEKKRNIYRNLFLVKAEVTTYTLNYTFYKLPSMLENKTADVQLGWVRARHLPSPNKQNFFFFKITRRLSSKLPYTHTHTHRWGLQKGRGSHSNLQRRTGICCQDRRLQKITVYFIVFFFSWFVFFFFSLFLFYSLQKSFLTSH